jgi:hypothetical protein
VKACATCSNVVEQDSVLTFEDRLMLLFVMEFDLMAATNALRS